jgi:hypothetical protein
MAVAFYVTGISTPEVHPEFPPLLGTLTTVDLCEIEEVTDEGCTAIKNVAEYMGQDQTMVVLYIPDREATRSLERSGIADDGRIVLVASSPSSRISLAV